MIDKALEHAECRSIHSRLPKATGKMQYSEEFKKLVPEIIWVCKEGCSEEKNELSGITR